MGGETVNAAQLIRALRAASNAGLQARDVAQVAAAFAPDVRLITGGELFDGRDAVSKAYADRLAATVEDGGALVSALRTPGRIFVDRAGQNASEPGRWRWVVKTAQGEAAFAGDYLAAWTKIDGQWRMTAELYAETGCTGPGCSL
jgi:ketosteroid isomerase-like protein